jgi:glutaminase
VHRHVGREPSGQSFNELALSPRGLPHNPMVNAGGIMTTSLIRPDLDIADRFDHVGDLAAAGRRSAGRLQQRGVLVRAPDRGSQFRPRVLDAGKRRVPPGVDLQQTLGFYFQNCSIELDTEMLAIAAASLANAGVCPLTEDPVFSPATVQSCLSLMSSCGMYDFSGEFAFTIGLPAKSGVSGAMMVIIPGLMGIGVWSPRLDEHGNSVRGIEFCRKLVAEYSVHVFESLASGPGRSIKRDPRRKKNQSQIEGVVALCWAASQGDINEVRGLLATGIDPGIPDYDGRTALHLAAAEGQTEIVSYLLATGTNAEPVDRWDGTPLSDAQANDHSHIVELLQHALNQVPTEAEA